MDNTRHKLFGYSSLFITLVLNLPKLLALRKDGIVARFWHFDGIELCVQALLTFLFCLVTFYYNRARARIFLLPRRPGAATPSGVTTRAGSGRRYRQKASIIAHQPSHSGRFHARRRDPATPLFPTGSLPGQRVWISVHDKLAAHRDRGCASGSSCRNHAKRTSRTNTCGMPGCNRS